MGEIGIYAVMYELMWTIGRNNGCLCLWEKLEYMQWCMSLCELLVEMLEPMGEFGIPVYAVMYVLMWTISWNNGTYERSWNICDDSMSLCEPLVEIMVPMGELEYMEWYMSLCELLVTHTTLLENSCTGSYMFQMKTHIAGLKLIEKLELYFFFFW